MNRYIPASNRNRLEDHALSLEDIAAHCLHHARRLRDVRKKSQLSSVGQGKVYSALRMLRSIGNEAERSACAYTAQLFGVELDGP